MPFIKILSEKFKDTADPSTYFADKDVAESRLKICLDCEYLWKITRQCSKCYCFIDGKTKLKTEECPIKKW